MSPGKGLIADTERVKAGRVKSIQSMVLLLRGDGEGQSCDGHIYKSLVGFIGTSKPATIR